MLSLLFLGDWYTEYAVDARAAVGEVPFVLNLEAPISRRGIPTPGKINLRMGDPHLLESFGRWPVAVCLANNHIFDYGPSALQDTLNYLMEREIAFFGAGHVADNYHNPLLLTIDGEQVALMGYVCDSTHPVPAEPGSGYGAAPLDLARIEADIATARQRGATRICLQLHWGTEQVLLPKPDDVRLACRLIDMGVDVIIGHHAHVAQPVNNLAQATVAYGLGNFVFAAKSLTKLFDDRLPVHKPYYPHERNLWSYGIMWWPRQRQTQAIRCRLRRGSVRPYTALSPLGLPILKRFVSTRRSYEVLYRLQYRWDLLRYRVHQRWSQLVSTAPTALPG